MQICPQTQVIEFNNNQTLRCCRRNPWQVDRVGELVVVGGGATYRHWRLVTGWDSSPLCTSLLWLVALARCFGSLLWIVADQFYLCGGGSNPFVKMMHCLIDLRVRPTLVKRCGTTRSTYGFLFFCRCPRLGFGTSSGSSPAIGDVSKKRPLSIRRGSFVRASSVIS